MNYNKMFNWSERLLDSAILEQRGYFISYNVASILIGIICYSGG